jgi:8-oxo-dGTP pyrophosphatase MutT (NUDIX family)
MNEGERTHVAVAAALITDAKQRVLLTFNERWRSYTLPMSRRRPGRLGNEPAPRAALRAAAEALGTPVRLVAEGPRLKRVLGRLESARELVEKIYTYTVCHVEPHPDFANMLQIRQPHLWLSPHLILSGAYEPISESARFILRTVLADLEIPARIQHTSVLVIQRETWERGRQFLVRWNLDWGYALPAKRWSPADNADPAGVGAGARAAAERIVRDELGLEPDTDATLTPARIPQLMTHGVSATKGAPAHGAATDYTHSLFDAMVLTPEKMRSERPLVWVTPEEIHSQWTAATQPASDSPPARAGRISRTAYEILYRTGELVEIERPEVKKGDQGLEPSSRSPSEGGTRAGGAMRESEAAVALVRREQDGQTVWLTQWNPKWGRFHFVSGHRRPQETFRECLVREIAEELQLTEGADYQVSPRAPMHLYFADFSESAHTETWYNMELFEVELSADALAKLESDPENRWLTEAEIDAAQTHDGRPASATMKRLLEAWRGQLQRDVPH